MDIFYYQYYQLKIFYKNNQVLCKTCNNVSIFENNKKAITEYFNINVFLFITLYYKKKKIFTLLTMLYAY